MLTRTTLSLALTIAALAVPAAAEAETIRVNGATGVNDATCGTGSDLPCDTINYAAGRAQASAAADTIAVAPGTYAETITINGLGDKLAGSGSCNAPATCTIIQPAAGAADVVESSPVNDGGQVSGVRIKSATAGSRTALLMSGDDAVVRDVVIESDSPNSTKTALRMGGGGDLVVDHVNLDDNGNVVALYALGTADSLTVTDSSVTSTDSYTTQLGDVGNVVVRRTALRRTMSGAQNSVLIGDTVGTVRVESSLITGSDVGIAVGGPLTVVNSTIDPGARGGNDGTAVSTFYADAGESSIVRDSLLLGAVSTSSGQPLSCSTSVVSGIAGTLSPSCVNGTAGNIAAAPTALFANVATGDYRLKPGSPAVETGSTTASAAGETTDILGNPRVLDGNLDCVARRDRGAYELTGFAKACPKPPQQAGGGGGTGTTPPPLTRDTKKPTFSRLVGARTRLSFRLSEVARVAITIERKGRKRRRTVYRKVGSFAVRQAKAGVNRPRVPAKLAKKLKTPSTYRVTVVATDLAGNRSARVRDSFTVKPKKRRKRR